MAMKLTLTLVIALLALAHHGSLKAQSNADLHEGVRFEVAFGYVWNETSERPLPDPYQILITSSADGVARVEFGPPNARVLLVRSYERLKTLRVTIPMEQARHITLGAIESNAVTVTSTSPISVSTVILYNGNGNQTLHYPVAAWDTSYCAFS